MVGEIPPRKRGKYKLWAQDSNAPIPRTTKWRLHCEQSTSSNIEVRHNRCSYEIQNQNNPSHLFHEDNPHSGDEDDSESRCADNVGACRSHGNESDIDDNEDELSTDEESSYESDSETAENDTETGEDCGDGDVMGLYEEDNLLLYPNAEVSKLAAHVLVNLFVMEHKLSNQALEDLIRLINILLPNEHKFLRSGYLLKKYFVNLFHEPLPRRHKYCGRCLDNIPQAMNACNNEKCKKVSTSVKEFLEIDLCNQLSRLYKGTTWISEILWQVYNDGAESTAMIFDRVSFLERDRVDVTTLPSPRLLHSHLNYDVIPKGKSKDTRCKYIYVARNPKDLAVSFYEFMKDYGSLAGFNGPWEFFARLFAEGKVVYGHWSDHVLGWWSHRDDPNVLFLKYEDLIKDLHSNVCSIAKFLGKQLSEDIIKRISGQCSFNGMRKNMSNYWPERTAQGPKLLRKGKIGDWKNYFTQEQNEMFGNEVMNTLIGSGLEFDFED